MLGYVYFALRYFFHKDLRLIALCILLQQLSNLMPLTPQRAHAAVGEK